MKNKPKIAFLGTRVATLVLPELKKVGIEVTKTIKSKEKEDLEKLVNEDWDLFIVAHYGKIIPKSILEIPKYGSLNIHPSLLPKYRGPSPVQSAILAGEEQTGVSIMLVDEKMDHGGIVGSERLGMRDWGHLKLEDELFRIGAQLLGELIPKWIDGEVKAKAQDHDKATYSKKFTNGDAFIKSETILGTASQDELSYAMRQVRALNPEPGTWALLNTKRGERRVRIHTAHIDNTKLIPEEITPEGKKTTSWRDFLNGNNII